MRHLLPAGLAAALALLAARLAAVAPGAVAAAATTGLGGGSGTGSGGGVRGHRVLLRTQKFHRAALQIGHLSSPAARQEARAVASNRW